MVSSNTERLETMKNRILHILLLTALCALSVVLMGGGNDCPKVCISKEAPCTTNCGGDINGTCLPEPGDPNLLYCDDTVGPPPR